MGHNVSTQALGSASGAGLKIPSWLRSLFPGGADLQGASSAAPTLASSPDSSQSASDGSSSSSSAATKPSDEDAQDLEQLKELRNMTMEGYVEYCKKMRSGSTPPRPRQPPVPRTHHDYRLFKDTRRIAFLRLQQHERIGSLVTKAEGDMILEKGEEVLRDRTLLQAIAERTGLYIDLEVKDCIQQFLNLRKRGSQLHRYVAEHQRPLPKTDDDQRAALKFMEREDEQAELKATLARRDPQACPLRHKLPWAGTSALCELTGLKYGQCCGRLGELPAEAAAKHLEKLPGWPPSRPQAQGTENKQLSADTVARKLVQRRFKGRAEKHLRRGALRSMSPHFRDQ